MVERELRVCQYTLLEFSGVPHLESGSRKQEDGCVCVWLMTLESSQFFDFSAYVFCQLPRICLF